MQLFLRIFAAVLIVILLGFNTFCLFTIGKIKNEATEKLGELYEHARFESADKISAECEEFTEYWLSEHHTLCLIVRHDLLDQVTISVSRFVPLAKFGENGTVIARALGDFVTCTIISLSGNTTAASYSDGTLKIIDSSGETIRENKVEYLDNPACSPAQNGMDLWFAVPDSNAIINYSVKHDRIEFRIGSPKEKAFCHPVDVSVYDNKLFICNANSYKIRAIDFTNYNVTDYCVFNEPVSKYFRVKDTEYAVMRSGVYSL